VPATGTAIAADAAGDMALGGDTVTNFEAAHFHAHFDDLSVKLMADREWYRDRCLCPVIPFEDVVAFTSAFIARPK